MQVTCVGVRKGVSESLYLATRSGFVFDFAGDDDDEFFSSTSSADEINSSSCIRCSSADVTT